MRYEGVDPFALGPVKPQTFWLHFSPEHFAHCLAVCQTEMPAANAVRLWLSFGAWQRGEAAFLQNLEVALAVCERAHLAVLPCLFARVGTGPYGDKGELALDHILPDTGWAYRRGFYIPYFRTLGRLYGHDPRILGWDVCAGALPFGFTGTLARYETRLLREMVFALKACGVAAPVGFAPAAPRHGAQRQPPFYDFLLCEEGCGTDAAAGMLRLGAHGLSAVFTAKESYAVPESTEILEDPL